MLNLRQYQASLAFTSTRVYPCEEGSSGAVWSDTLESCVPTDTFYEVCGRNSASINICDVLFPMRYLARVMFQICDMILLLLVSTYRGCIQVNRAYLVPDVPASVRVVFHGYFLSRM